MKTLKKIAHAKKSLKKTIKKKAGQVAHALKENVNKAVTVVKKDLEGKVEQAKETVKKEAKIVGKESRGIVIGLGKWWNNSSSEERIFTLLGILFLIIGFYFLRHMIVGIVFLTLGLFFLTGYFTKKGG